MGNLCYYENRLVSLFEDYKFVTIQGGKVTMAIIGINTGSGYNTYTPGGGIGGAGQEKVNSTSKNQDFGGKGISEAGKLVSTENTPLENQVAVSPDGDTVQISPKSVAKFEAAVKKAQNEEMSDESEIKAQGSENDADKSELKAKEAETARKEANLKAERRAEILKKIAETAQKNVVKTEEKQPVSFAGKSDSDITRLYLEGEITKSDYDSEMSVREKLRAKATKNDNDFVNKTSESDRIEKKIERSGKDLKVAFSDAASKTFDAVTRLDTIDAAEGTKKAEQEKAKSERREVKFSYR